MVGASEDREGFSPSCDIIRVADQPPGLVILAVVVSKLRQNSELQEEPVSTFDI